MTLLSCPPHYWLINTPDGQPSVTGRCARCGEERRFKVTLDEDAQKKAQRSIRPGRRDVSYVDGVQAPARQNHKRRAGQ